MTTTMENSLYMTQASHPMTKWLLVILGVAALYVPTYVSLWNGTWNSEEQGHGPLILAVVIWLFWQKRDAFAAIDDRPMPVTGFGTLVFGLLMYVVGRSQSIEPMEVASHIPVLIGAILIVGGPRTLRSCWFPLLFLAFMVPLPGILIDGLTGSLKRNVSEVAEHLLYAAGYPIARSGVTLSIGPYQLLVADACSGMHSLYSLSALGLLYLYLMNHTSIVRNALLAALIIPIALVSNLVRVIFLVLVTYHLGDEAGQGFLHGFAGMVLFVAALICLFLFDSILGLIPAFRDRRESK